LLVTAFRSPATATPFRASLPGSMFPACYFASRLTSSSARSAFRLRCPNRFAPIPAASTLQTRCGLYRLAWAGRFSCLHSPLGLLPPSGSKRSAGLATRQSAFQLRPISFRSPQPLSIARVWAADHRSRSATFPEACCSSNLLEPIAVWRLSGFRVNGFCIVSLRFPQFLCALLPISYGSSVVDRMWIKRGS
jgi:hypothetical protein